eukprot:maker-scaffold275_size226830-snap-gene-0.25 protein:Tk00620 transcript:maker-scaffold275_size226830-snap-gene-0.25-mRNA-1 annotation:"2-oxoglutarate dehydrogenase e1 component dhktd1-like mitochondrial"
MVINWVSSIMLFQLLHQSLRPGLLARPSLIVGRAGYQSHQGIFGSNPQAYQERLEALNREVQVDFHARNNHPNVYRMIEAFRRSGHIYAKINPVPFRDQLQVSGQPELSLKRFGLSAEDHVPTSGLVNWDHPGKAEVHELREFLEKVYCGPMAVEFDSVECDAEREWLYQSIEKLAQVEISQEQKRNLAFEMLRSQNFDHFMATKFSSVKRYGGEGAESMMGIFTELIGSAGENGIKEIIVGMAHRGRLNVMTGLFNYPPVMMFRKMRGLPEFPPEQQGSGDVLSHLTSSVDLPTNNGSQVHITMLPNPSHLEAVNPVACGKARARHLTQNKADYGPAGSGEVMGEDVLCLQVHGDAALVGQGINQETLQLSQVPHFSNGGSLHVVINNQVGFTTPGDRGRTSRYCTDLAKQIGAPVIHVNGDQPEQVVKATQLALAYQRRYRKDVFLDLSCYRRHGHNELDDPTFTNPLLYKTIHQTETIPNLYAEQLIEEDTITNEEVSKTINDHTSLCTDHYQMIDSYDPKAENLRGAWSKMEQPPSAVTQWDTGLPLNVLKYIGAQSVNIPDTFNLHSHLKKIHVDARMKKLESGGSIDWGTAESLAVGSLLYQGFNVRFSGQDVGRATFAHRHAMLVDQDSNEMFIPFNELKQKKPDCGHLEMANSPLSEEAVLGFEYGMSVENPKNLIIWEAQFGDFFNGAQIILDTFVACGESKWGLQSSLTMLLPHGMDGAGPEHSSCRMERFLQMSDSKESDGADGDDVNWHVVNPTTSAQYFHLLRRQMIRNFRKPLVVVGPKVLLRLPAASSSLLEMESGTAFKTVLSDPRFNGREPDQVKKVVFVSGKHYYALARHAEEKNVRDIAFVRVEQLCPFPTQELQDELKKYKNAKYFVWSQEEHRNMGAWSFVYPRFRNLVGVNLDYIGREVLCQPAAGVGRVHQEEAKYVVEDPGTEELVDLVDLVADTRRFSLVAMWPGLRRFLSSLTYKCFWEEEAPSSTRWACWMIRNFRKPLVVVGPKVLLRLPAASSSLLEMESGTAFKTVLSDPRFNGREPDQVKKVVFVSGKHYYALARHAEEKNVRDIAFVRVEQLCPFPTQELQDELKKYKNAKYFVWSQEEHRNMGAWSFVYPRFRNLVGVNLDYIGREVLCQPAAGVGRVHQEEAKYVVEDVFK